jgi:hypothetical protein
MNAQETNPGDLREAISTRLQAGYLGDRGFIQRGAAPDDSSSGFWNIIGNAANIVGLATGSVQLIQWILPFVTGGGDDTVNQIDARIDLLQSQLTGAIEAVAEQIKAQIQDLDNFVKGETVTDLITRAKSAEMQLHDSYVANDPATKGALIANADQDVTYVSVYVRQAPNLSYLPALSLGGTVRMDIIRVLDPKYRSDPIYQAEINNLIALLQQQINLIVTNVTNSHSVMAGRQVLGTTGGNSPRGEISPAYPRIVWGNYMAHLSKGHMIDKFPYGAVWELYGVDNPLTQAQAIAAAQQAYSQGITAELNFLAVPTFQAVLSNWEAFV